jgi:hypothetical protein
MSKKIISGNYRLPVSLSIMIFLFPWIISDGENIHFLYYVNSFNFFSCKVLLGILLPFLLFLCIEQISKNGKWVLAFMSTAGISFYISQSVLHASLIALTLTLSWIYTKRALSESSYIISIFGVILILYFQHALFDSFHFLRSGSSRHEIRYNDDLESESASLSQVTLPHNVYLIIFDELSRKNLYEGSNISTRFPNFKKLSEESLTPPLSTTNFDSTTPSILTMLRGALAKTSHNSDQGVTSYIEKNLFDHIADSQLYIWGWVEPYCRALQVKQKNSYCFDEHKQLSEKNFLQVLHMDIIRFLHIYFFNYPLGIIKAANNILEQYLPALRNSDRNAYLSAIMANSDSALWKGQIPRDLERLHDFLPHIGTHQNSLYFFHSALPHFAYFGAADLQIREDESSIAFWIAETEAEHEKVTQAYERTIQAADTVLGKIMKQIEKKDPAALVIVTSDHGAAQDFNHPLKRPTGELLKSVVEIPFFIKLPAGHPLTNTDLSIYQHLDFLPTLFEALGIEKREDWEGVSIFQAETSPFYHESGDSVFREYAPDDL